MTPTRLYDSPVQYQRGPERGTGWGDSDVEEEDDQLEVMMKDSAQGRRKGNSKYRHETLSSLSQTRGKIDSDYQYEPPSSLVESDIQSLTSSAQHERRDRSADDHLGPTPRTKSQNHSNNRREESYPELNDWNSLYDEDLEEDEESERYIPEENFRVQSFGIKDPALVGGNDEVRRRRREQLESTITKTTSESRDEDNNQRSEEDVRTSWHKDTPHMLVEGERIHGALGPEVNAFDKFLLQEANIQSDNGMRALSISEEKEIVPWKRLSDRR
ncbi:uncharacterized protein EAF02_003609 [Botrytis sinoallii]|uniref:uncharacterized protein n=1 Tax=Botrytis sinoallii TaxID=1463999 RepID=UPI0019005E19|nr:uncharacterized protein EAF02_003609 [Botrytis sinoallii]KAF7886962.1 hypothetical protein EAF02_003609 [Botrytis sinoallii]